MSNDTIVVLAKRMRSLQGEKEELEESLKFVNLQLDEIRLRQIPDAMADAEIRTLTIEGVGRVQLATDVYASILPGKKQEAYSWFLENGYDGLVQPYVQPSTMKAAMKAAMKEGQFFPDDLFSVIPFVRASIVGKG